MEFYEEYIPLIELYPITFAPTDTTVTNISTMPDPPISGGVTISIKYIPPKGLEREWDEATDEHDEFMASTQGLTAARKAWAMKRLANSWVHRRVTFLGSRTVLILPS